MKIPFLSQILPFFGGDNSDQKNSHDNASPASSGSGSSNYHQFSPLYRWQRYTGRGRTEVITLTAQTQYKNSAGHPWCFEGFGDAFSMAFTQLLKSDFSLVLSNAAADIDKSRPELLWDKESNSFYVVNKSAGVAITPGVEPHQNGAANISYPFSFPQNAVTWPVLMGLVSKFFDDSAFGQKLRSITDMLCQLADAEAAANLWPDNVYFCFIEDLVGALLICGQSEQDIACKETMKDYEYTREDFPLQNCNVPPESIHAGVVPQSFSFVDADLQLPLLFEPLVDMASGKQLPPTVSKEIMHVESLTYLVLYRAAMIAASFSRKPYLCGAEHISAPTIIPGWRLPLILSMREEGDPLFLEKGLVRDGLPLAFVAQKVSNPCEIAIIIRGTASMFEWEEDFHYWQTPFSINGEILAHIGFSHLLNVMAPVLEAFIADEMLKHGCTCQNTRLCFSGHSLGAGVAQMAALFFAEKYADHGCPLQVSGVFFAPPRIFNRAGAEKFRRMVNGRVIMDIGDGLSYMPCYDGNAKSGWPRCTRGHMTPPGAGRDMYADNYGIIELEVDYMSRSGGKGIDAVMQTIFPSGKRQKQSTLGSLFSKLFELSIPGLNQVPSLGVMGATHVCSFACEFSQRACGSSFQWWCNSCPMLI